MTMIARRLGGFSKSRAASRLLCICALATGTSAWSQKITDVTVYKSAFVPDQRQSIIVEISVAELRSNDIPRLVVFPASGVEQLRILDSSASGALIRAEFSAPPNYTLTELALSYPNNVIAPFRVTPTMCGLSDVRSEYDLVPVSQVKNKYGNGVAKQFHVIKISLVNSCPLSIIVPLAGITVVPRGTTLALLKSSRSMVPYPLEHISSIYSADRKLTGARAIFFNSLQALATLGSAIEPFFAHGFTQGVSILGGGFTQAAGGIFKDMSAEQLQNLTSQSFQNSEQIGPNGGSLNKFLFVPRTREKDCAPRGKKDCALENALQLETINVFLEIIPALPPAGTKQAAPATP